MAPGRTVSLLKLTFPVKESQIDWEFRAKKTELSTDGSLPLALRNGRKTMNSKGFLGLLPVYLVVSEYHQKFASDSPIPPNLFKKKNELSLDLIGFIKQFMN